MYPNAYNVLQMKKKQEEEERKKIQEKNVEQFKDAVAQRVLSLIKTGVVSKEPVPSRPDTFNKMRYFKKGATIVGVAAAAKDLPHHIENNEVGSNYLVPMEYSISDYDFDELADANKLIEIDERDLEPEENRPGCSGIISNSHPEYSSDDGSSGRSSRNAGTSEGSN